MSKETLLNLYTGLPVRKNFALKPQLDWVVNQLQAGGFWHKWNNEQFIPQVLGLMKIFIIIISTFIPDFYKSEGFLHTNSSDTGPAEICLHPVGCWPSSCSCSLSPGNPYSSILIYCLSAHCVALRLKSSRCIQAGSELFQNLLGRAST